ncbi:MAG: DUF5320 domain-containing protein [Clostridiales bacterium]|nr:DUF5320 domain-containing protein [Clostridiales bacterium]
MPAGDRRGPAGQGPMTGRRMGQCADGTTERGTFFGFGRGRGNSRFGSGRGILGFGRGYAVDETNNNEVQSLKNRIAELENIVKNK